MYRFRIRYTKTGILRFLSHLELLRALGRAFRRAELPLTFSRGFSPHPRISHGLALSVGTKSRTEYVDVLLEEKIEARHIIAALNRALPQDLEALEGQYIPLNAPSIASEVDLIIYRIEGKLVSSHGAVKQAIEDFMRQTSIIIRRKKGDREISFDARPLLQDLEIGELEEERFSFSVSVRNVPTRGVRPEEIVNAFAELYNQKIEIENVERVELLRKKNGKKVLC